MQAYLFKSVATVMVMVMATTAVVCRCGMMACMSQASAAAVARPDPKSRCERGCAKHDGTSDEQQAPDKCGDCSKDKLSLDRSAASSDPVIEVELFAPVTEYVDFDTAAPLLSHPSRDQGRTGPLIDVLRQSCALLI